MTASLAELTLAAQLEQSGIPFEREFRFAPSRKWRADFRITRYREWVGPGLLVEVEGGAFTGGHRRGTRADLDCEKSNAAVLAGWIVLRFTPRMVENGTALEWIRQALGLAVAA